MKDRIYEMEQERDRLTEHASLQILADNWSGLAETARKLQNLDIRLDLLNAAFRNNPFEVALLRCEDRLTATA